MSSNAYRGREREREAIFLIISNADYPNSYKGISLLDVIGKVYGRILNESLKEITERNKIAEQGCVDQIFAAKTVVQKYVGKDQKLYDAFMYFEKAYDSVDKKIQRNGRCSLMLTSVVL